MNDDQETRLEEENWEDEGGFIPSDVPEDWEYDDWGDDWDNIDDVDDFEYYELGREEEDVL